MKYAVIKTGGKQYKVSEGDSIEVERIASLSAKADYIFDNVLLFVADEVCQIGNPTLSDVMVKATVVDQIKGEKIRVSKFKAKARYRRVTGHRQALTRLTISEISTGAKSAKPTKKIEEPEHKEEKKIRKPRTPKATK